ncbi:MAG: Crp/Fnr family transcriptional regulator [Jatrophihabitantaceae bacterium]
MLSREQRAVVDQLTGFPTWAGRAKDDIRALAETGTVVTLPDGWAFVQEGTPADAAYVLLEGAANVLNGRTVIASLSPGAIIGEMAYLDGGQRHASVATHGRVRALRLDYDKLNSLVSSNPSIKTMLQTVDREHRKAAQP